MSDIIFKDESYKIIGVCMEIHRELGMGFKENIYKDALEIEFKTITFLTIAKNNLRSNTRE